MLRTFLLKFLVSFSLFVNFQYVTADENKCPYAGKTISQDQLDEILLQHREWLSDLDKAFKNTGQLYTEITVDVIQRENLTDEQVSLLQDKRKANFCRANLAGKNFGLLDLRGALFYETNLEMADFTDAILSNANFFEANLYRVKFYGAKLENVSLGRADLAYADFSYADLRNAIFIWSDLKHADFLNADLRNTKFLESNMTGVNYEPKGEGVPDIPMIARAIGISTLQFRNNVQGLIQLKHAFKNSGFRNQERMITYAIKHNETLHSWDRGLYGKIESIFSKVFFEWTTMWGMEPGRALIILFALILIFPLFYLIVFRAPSEYTGIWLYRSKDRPVDLDKSDRVLVNLKNDWRLLPTALYFSVLSAFNLGWRDINVGSWLLRLQFKDYSYRPVGWVRMVSGIQSLLSVYLLAIWILTYFGRPFE